MTSPRPLLTSVLPCTECEAHMFIAGSLGGLVTTGTFILILWMERSSTNMHSFLTQWCTVGGYFRDTPGQDCMFGVNLALKIRVTLLTTGIYPAETRRCERRGDASSNDFLKNERAFSSAFLACISNRAWHTDSCRNVANVHTFYVLTLIGHMGCILIQFH